MHATDRRCLVEVVFTLTAVTVFLTHRVSRGLGLTTFFYLLWCQREVVLLNEWNGGCDHPLSIDAHQPTGRQVALHYHGVHAWRESDGSYIDYGSGDEYHFLCQGSCYLCLQLRVVEKVRGQVQE